MLYTIQTGTENGVLLFKTESCQYAVWLADKMVEDFGDAEVHRLDDDEDRELIYRAVPKNREA